METPSQSRFVTYFSQLVQEAKRLSPPIDGATQALDIQLPAKKALQLKSIVIKGLAGLGRGDGSDLSLELWIDHHAAERHYMDFGLGTNCRVNYNPIGDTVTVEPVNCPHLVGDCRLKFSSSSSYVPKNYEKCAFYFWLNTHFVAAVQPSGDQNGTTPAAVDQRVYRFLLNRAEMDNPHKAKTWRVFRDKFACELTFQDAVA